MSSNINRRISDPMFEILCRRVSIHDIFDDNEEHIVIDETDEDDEEEVPPLLTYQTFEEIFAAPMVIDESDEKIDKVSRIVIDETDEDEVSPLLADQTFGAIIYPPLVIDESDEEVDEVARIVIDETDEDDVSCPIVIDENHKDVGEDKVSHKECQENEPFKRKQLCPKLMLFKLTNKLEKIVSKIEKLELISCDLDSGITTEFDSCVMLRLQSVEVMNKICKLNGSSFKSKPIDFKDLTKFPEYNKILETLFKNASSPSSFSKSLQYFKRCNKFYKYGITEDNVMHEIVQTAFGEILNILRKRRDKAIAESHNCYITKYDNNEIDPALLDKELEMKLLSNRKNSKSIADAINEFRRLPLELTVQLT